MEAPMYHDHNLSGYLGVDNYKESDAADMKYLLENMAVYLSRKRISMILWTGFAISAKTISSPAFITETP